MSDKITIYLKPTCSKCRETMSLLNGRGANVVAVDYYRTPLTAAELSALLAKLELSARDVLRADEPIAAELGLNEKALSDDELVEIMVKHPDLIQRPIVVRGERAVLARPPQKVEQLL